MNAIMDRLADLATQDGCAVLALRDPDPEIRAAAWYELGRLARTADVERAERN
jgi:hypothetical protein